MTSILRILMLIWFWKLFFKLISLNNDIICVKLSYQTYQTNYMKQNIFSELKYHFHKLIITRDNYCISSNKSLTLKGNFSVLTTLLIYFLLLKLYLFVMIKTVSNREICFLKQCYHCASQGVFCPPHKILAKYDLDIKCLSSQVKTMNVCSFWEGKIKNQDEQIFYINHFIFCFIFLVPILFFILFCPLSAFLSLSMLFFFFNNKAAFHGLQCVI